MRDPKRVAILISGRGSNMRALVEHTNNYEVVLIASNKPEAAGLEWVRERGLPTWALDSKGMAKEEFDRLLSAVLEEHGLTEACRVGAQHLAGLWGHPDQDEGPRAFTEKREPNWQDLD